MSSRVLKWKVDFETILCYSNCDGYLSFHSFGVTLPTGDRFHTTPICVVVNNHATTQKMEPLASIVSPYLSWKSGECFLWLCLALICWKLRILTLLIIFLAKGNIMKVWWDCSWLQLLGYFLVDTWKTNNEQWHLICIHLLSLWMFLPEHLSSVLVMWVLTSWCPDLSLSSAPD